MDGGALLVDVAFGHPAVQVRFILAVLFDHGAARCLARSIADGAIVPVIVAVIQVGLAAEQIAFGFAVEHAETRVEVHEETLLEQGLEGFAVGVEHHMRGNTIEVRAEVEAAAEVLEVGAAEAVSGLHFIVPDPVPAEAPFHGKRSGNVAARVIQKVTDGEAQAGPRTVPLDGAVPVAEITIILSGTHGHAYFHGALCGQRTGHGQNSDSE